MGTVRAFYDRADELAALERRYGGPEGELLVVWGRRRVGKTELLSRFLQGRRGFLFEATEGLARDHLADLTTVLARETGNRLLGAQALTTWEAALAAIEDYAETGPCAVVLDEFQWLAAASSSLGSVVNRWWRRARSLPICLVICGSEVSFFETTVLRGAMFGRRTGQIEVSPFGYKDAALFFPQWPPEDRVRAYAVFGGMPYYLEQIHQPAGLRDNILGTVLRRDGVLREEARLLLYEELPEPGRYFSVLRAIANGATRRGEILNKTALPATFVDGALERLVALYLVERAVPVTAANPERTKQVSYRLLDGYLNFYFRFVHPYESRLVSDDDARDHMDEVVAPQLDQFVSAPAFERIAQEYARKEERATAAGRWWGQVVDAKKSTVREVDVVALDANREVLAVGSCKWTNEPMGTSDLDELLSLAPHVPGTTSRTRAYLFSRSGFTEALRERAVKSSEHTVLVGPTELFQI